MEENISLKGKLEALLFTMGESVPLSRLAQALGEEEETIMIALSEMEKEYDSPDRGITLIELDGSYQIGTKTDSYEYIRNLVAQPKKRRLTDVLLETLSIIAYKQPVTRQEIESIRGVKCDFAVNKLIEYGFVRELGRLDTIGHPIVFGTTEEFLRCFGISSVEELPDIDEVKKQDFFMEASMEIPGNTEIET